MTNQFITFGQGYYIEAGNRLLKQADALKLFDKTTLYTDAHLKQDGQFWNTHGSFIEQNRRGYGYWLWKPYLIKKTMEQMKDNDLLLYLDSGCEIDIREKEYLVEMFELVKQDYIVGTFTQIEGCWNKMDLILKLDMNDDKYLYTKQRQAGALLFLVCDRTRHLVNQWYDIASEYHMIDDTPSINTNVSCFRDHRHDQSIFSLLSKKYNLYSIISLTNACIKYDRNKSGISKLAPSPFNIAWLFVLGAILVILVGFKAIVSFIYNANPPVSHHT